MTASVLRCDTRMCAQGVERLSVLIGQGSASISARANSVCARYDRYPMCSYEIDRFCRTKGPVIIERLVKHYVTEHPHEQCKKLENIH